MNDSEIIVVSGLPRSGTSLMMQMLANGGIDTLTDHVRTPDPDNPKGYFEFEPVKHTKQDASWLPAARGKVVKVVSQLLFELPSAERYRIIFMERDLDEVLTSQEKMLIRLGRTGAPREPMKRAFGQHLERLRQWLTAQANMATLYVKYQDLISRPREEADRVREFVGRPTDLEGMVATVDPALYRNRK